MRHGGKLPIWYIQLTSPIKLGGRTLLVHIGVDVVLYTCLTRQ